MIEICENRNILIEKTEAQILSRQLEEAFILICVGQDVPKSTYSGAYIKAHYKQMWELFRILSGQY